MAKEKEKPRVNYKHRTLKGGQNKIVLDGPRVKEARKFLRKVTKALRKVVFAPINQKKV